jgi:hypothetical protein
MNTLQAEEWIEFHSVILFWLEGEGVRQWWRSTGRYRFGAAFGDFIEAEIASLAAAASTGD